MSRSRRDRRVSDLTGEAASLSAQLGSPGSAERVVLVVGASRGIGAAIARGFVGTGARVVVAARDEAALTALRQELDPPGGRVLVAKTDVTVVGEVHDAVQLALDRFGGWIAPSTPRLSTVGGRVDWPIRTWVYLTGRSLPACGVCSSA